MSGTVAQLRHRELTQEIYNIGDEVAEYVEHLAEAIADWDVELVEDCMAEFEDIVGEARDDSRRVVAELAGVRHALTSGLRQGSMSVPDRAASSANHPGQLSARVLEHMHPIQGGLVVVRDLSDALNARTATVTERLADIVEWLLARTALAATDLDALSLPSLYGRVSEDVTAAVDAWVFAVAESHPAYTRTMRGSNPPGFLIERARIDAVVAKVAAKLQAKRGAVS